MTHACGLLTIAHLLLFPAFQLTVAQPQSGGSIPMAVRAPLQAAAGGSKAWPLRIRRAVVATTDTHKDEPSHTETETIRLDSLGQGLVRARTTGASGHSIEAVSVYGFYEAFTLFSKGTHRNERTVTEFSTDLPITALAKGKPFSYAMKVRMVNDGVRSTIVRQTRCAVGEPIPASTLHPGLKGTALPITCSSSLTGEVATREKGFLLPEAGWYLPRSFEIAFLNSPTPFLKSTTRLLEVEGW